MADKDSEAGGRLQQCEEQLAQLQQQRRQWWELEEGLRRGLARLALFGFGNDDHLDKQLTRLRSAIRRDEPAETVTELLAEIEGTTRKLDLGKTEPADIQRHTLLNLLNAVPFPRHLSPEVRKLRQRLREPGAEDSTEGLLQEAAAIIQQSQAPPPRKGLGRLLGGAEPGGEAAAGAGSLERLDEFLGELQPPPALEPAVARLRERLKDSGGDADIQPLARDLSERLQELLAAEGGHPLGSTPLSPGLEDALHRLVDLLELPSGEPEEGESEQAVLRAWLNQGLTLSDLPELVREIHNRLAALRKDYEHEYRELEDFLVQLIGYLNDLNTHVSATQDIYTASSQGHKDLGDQLDAAMDGMESRLAEAGDLDALQEAVRQRVTEIRDKVAAHREADRERDQAFEAEVQTLHDRVRESEEEADRLKEALRRERELAHQDTLTGLPNRLGYEERAQQAAAYWRRTGTPLSLVVLDVDHFKAINDSYGHQAGDKALQAVAELLKGSLSRETDFVGRYGGEEFVCLLPATEEEQAAALAERMRVAVERARFTYQTGDTEGLTISAGVTEFRGEDTPETAFERADQALLQAKEAGRNRVQRAQPAAPS